MLAIVYTTRVFSTTDHDGSQDETRRESPRSDGFAQKNCRIPVPRGRKYSFFLFFLLSLLADFLRQGRSLVAIAGHLYFSLYLLRLSWRQSYLSLSRFLNRRHNTPPLLSFNLDHL